MSRFVLTFSVSLSVLSWNAAGAAIPSSGQTTGTVVLTSDHVIQLKAGKQDVFQARGDADLIRREIAELVPGDKITISWSSRQGSKFIESIHGKGTIRGTVSGKGDTWIEIAPEEGRTQKFRAPWRGGQPHQGGGPDQEIVKKIASLKVGAKVALDWEILEGKRAVDIRAE